MRDLSADQLRRLELVESLYQEGMTSVEISEFLNRNQIKTHAGLPYSPKLVWVSNDKFQKRKCRFLSTTVSVHQDYFYVKKGVKLWTE